MKGSQTGGILTLFRCQRRKFLVSKALAGILTLPLGASPVLPEDWNLSMGIRTCGIHRDRGGVTKYNAPGIGILGTDIWLKGIGKKAKQHLRHYLDISHVGSQHKCHWHWYHHCCDTLKVVLSCFHGSGAPEQDK